MKRRKLSTSSFPPTKRKKIDSTSLFKEWQEIILSGNVEELKALYDENAQNLPVADSEGTSAFHFAAQSGSVESFKYLITLWARKKLPGQPYPYSKQNIDGATPLHFAVRYGHLPMVKYLLNTRIDRTDEETNGFMTMTPVHYAARAGHIEIFEYLLENEYSITEKGYDQTTNFLFAAEGGHIHMVKYLLDKGSSIEERDDDKNTCLHLAARNGHVEMVKFLISLGCSVNDTNYMELTSILCACEEGHLLLVQYLISQGASLGIRNSDKDTCLTLASKEGHLQVVKFLITQGCSVHEKNAKGMTSLHYAANEGHIELVQFLLSHGSSIHNKASGSHFNSLLYAINGHLGLLQQVYLGRTRDCTNTSSHKLEKIDLMVRKEDCNQYVRKISENGFITDTIFINSHLEVIRLLLAAGATSEESSSPLKTFSNFTLFSFDLLYLLVNEVCVTVEEIKEQFKEDCVTAFLAETRRRKTNKKAEQI